MKNCCDDLCDNCDDDDMEPNSGDIEGDYDNDLYNMRDATSEFADPGGNSSLRAATASNPRNRPCPTCHHENVLTPKDVRLGYQCNRCADRAERGGDY